MLTIFFYYIKLNFYFTIKLSYPINNIHKYAYSLIFYLSKTLYYLILNKILTSIDFIFHSIHKYHSY
jgi:hypothetical protein